MRCCTSITWIQYHHFWSSAIGLGKIQVRVRSVRGYDSNQFVQPWVVITHDGKYICHIAEISSNGALVDRNAAC